MILPTSASGRIEGCEAVLLLSGCNSYINSNFRPMNSNVGEKKREEFRGIRRKETNNLKHVMLEN